MIETTAQDHRTVLLVEAEAATAMSEESSLLKHGFRVLTASSGEMAIATVKNTGNIDLILMGINLGNGMDGIETAEIISREKDIPIVFLSDHTQPEVVERTDRVTSFGYVVKNSGEAVLIASINVAFKLHEAYRQLKEKERMLRTGEERSRKAQAIARVGNWEIDLQTKKIWASEEAFRIYGIQQATSELPLDLVQQIVLPTYRERLDLALQGLVRQEAEYDEEFRIRRLNDGVLRVVHSRAELTLAKDGRPERVVGVLQDITERKQTEDALRVSETKLRAILDGSRDAIGVSKDGIRTFVNPAFVSLFGYESADELIGKPTIEMIAPENRPLIRERVEKRAGGEAVSPSYEATFLRKDGTPLLVEATVSVYMLGEEQFSLAILRDITDRRRAEEEVRLLKHSIDVHYDGAYWMNTDNEFIYVNEAACRVLGYERAELLGKTIYQVIPKVTVREMEGIWKELREGGSFLTESVGRRKNGSEFPVEIVTTYVQFGGREFACGFARDISEKRRLEEQLRQAQKMEAVGTLAGGVAHDFNNILTVIMGFANLIQMGMDAEDKLRQYVDQIVASSKRASDLVQSLLAFSRKQRIAPEPHKVNEVVASTAKLLARLLPEDIGLSLNLARQDALSLLDVSQIGQVLMNLATNGRDAMPHGGSLTITTERALLDAAFKRTHGFGRPGEYVRLSVSDTGMGMDAATMERIFEPFFTTKEVGKGTGLGLASAYGIVKQHNGYITVRSAPFEGSTFDIYLPVLDPLSWQEVPVENTVKQGVETILVVEDDPDVRNMLSRILESHGYTTIEAVDGDDAVRIYRENEHVDLVILDVVMPEKNGKEALDEIAHTDPGVKAIFVSGYTGDIVIDKGVQSERVDFLQKPLSVTALLTKVREVLDR